MTFEGATDVFSRAKRMVNYPLRRAIDVVVDDPAFREGYGAKSHHHAYKGGLYIHTAEVLENCLSVTAPLDTNVLYVAAVWHDYKKTRDYKEITVTDALLGELVKPDYTQYKRLIYHIAGSHAAWTEYAHLAGFDEAYTDQVAHCILAHHGRPEWGSAIQPQTPEAWTLHWADCMSAWFENGKYKEKS